MAKVAGVKIGDTIYYFQDLDAESAISDLEGVLHFIGSTSTDLSDGSTVDVLTPRSTGSLTKITGFVNGDLVIDFGGDFFVRFGQYWRAADNVVSSSVIAGIYDAIAKCVPVDQLVEFTDDQKGIARRNIGVPALSDLRPLVSTATSQSFTDEEKVQGRENIGAVGFVDNGAYDVTANNNNIKFVNLADLLGRQNLNTLIPTTLRKGGMSVKFVQSSDNKYVQYRLTSDTFNTTPANWQGVDDEPTVGSDNLVKSGAVAEALYDLNDDSIVKEGYELGSTGHYDANPNYNSSGDLYVREDLTYETNYTGNIFCYSLSGSFLGKVRAGNALLTDTAFVRLNWLNSGNKPCFISQNDSSAQFRIDSLDKRVSNAEETLNNADDALIMGSEHLVKGGAVAKSLYDLNDINAIKDNTGVSSVIGVYEVDNAYKASGNIYIDSSLEYETNTTSKIFCYKTEYSNGIPYSSYLGYVASGSALLQGTEFIRINWLKTSPTPYFASKKNIQSVQSRIDTVSRGIDDVYKVNGDDLQGKELTSTGDIIDNADWRVSQFIELKTDRTYKCNVSANYYFYNEFFEYISRQNISAGTFFNRNTVSGAKYMRTNAPIGAPIVITEYDSKGTELLQSRQYKGRAIVDSENVNDANYSLQGVQLPKESKVVSLDFTTANSLYDRSGSSIKLISIGNGIKLERVFVSAAEDNYYCQDCKCNIRVNVAGNYQDIPLRLNNYGSDLFSLRLKYPVLEVADDGKSTMITPMPSAFEGAYIAKDSNSFTIHNGDGSEYRNYLFANYNDVEELVDAMIDDLSEDFDIVKYACEGVSFDAIENFDKIYISKQVNEIYYTESSQIEYTGNVYYDSYPTIIKATDKGFVHNLAIGYKIDGELIKTMYFIWDGMWVKFTNLSLRTSDMVITYNSTFIDSVKNVILKPYKKMIAPMLSMQHQVVYSDDLINQNMVTSTNRQQNMLAYLAKKGFVGVNFNECVSIIKGGQAINSPVYCLTFDDRQKNLWTDERIRNIFNKYRAKPTLVYVFNVSDYNGENPPSSALTKEQYWELKNSGWDVISHGFCIHTGELSYGQFVNGFNKTKQKWLDWYGEDVCAYNAHGQEITNFQYYLLKNMGFTTIASGIALLGWYCNCGTTVDVQYKRVTWMDSEQSWDSVKTNIDNWVE